MTNLDRIIHERVMGQCAHVLTAEDIRPSGRVIYQCRKCGESGFDCETDYEGRELDVPAYLTDMREAWTVVEHLMALGYRYVLKGNWQGDGLHWVGFDEQDWADANPLYQGGPCASLPEAIGRAALTVMEERRRNAEFQSNP